MIAKILQKVTVPSYVLKMDTSLDCDGFRTMEFKSEAKPSLPSDFVSNSWLDNELRILINNERCIMVSGKSYALNETLIQSDLFSSLENHLSYYITSHSKNKNPQASKLYKEFSTIRMLNLSEKDQNFYIHLCNYMVSHANGPEKESHRRNTVNLIKQRLNVK